jgi:translation elongation factor EF-1alpha
MPVLDKVKEPAGYAISGKIESGFLKIGMNLAVLPTKKQLTVLNIHNTQDLKMNYAGPGENIVLSV